MTELTPAETIRAKYGGKTREAINRAIRAELLGGDACLDAMGLAHQLARKLSRDNLPGAADAQTALDALRRVANAMTDEVCQRYRLKH